MPGCRLGVVVEDSLSRGGFVTWLQQQDTGAAWQGSPGASTHGARALHLVDTWCPGDPLHLLAGVWPSAGRHAPPAIAVVHADLAGALKA